MQRGPADPEQRATVTVVLRRRGELPAAGFVSRADLATAAGADPAARALLARRASQLTIRRIRAGLARALEAHLAEARRPRKRTSAAVPLRRREVLYAAPEIRRLVGCLRDDREIRAQGTARVRRLLTDGTSPLYAHSPPGALATAVAAAIDSLHDEH